MEGQPKDEVLKPDVHVVRYSFRDDIEEDPYYDPQLSGYEEFINLMKNLRQEYYVEGNPSRYYPPHYEVEWKLKEVKDKAYGLTTYMAYDGEDPIGAVLGVDHMSWLKGLWLVVDPKYQKGDATKNLLEAVQNDYDSVRIEASTFGYRREDDKHPYIADDQKARKQRALLRYYERLGFQLDNSEEAKRDKTYADTVPMIWRKPGSQAA